MAETVGVFGQQSRLLVETLMNALPSKDPGDINAACALLSSLEPDGPLEAMLCSQMVTTHLITMQMASRTISEGQTVDGVNNGVNRISKLMGLFNRQLETLNKLRNGNQQTIQVQHVSVNQGGQAIVGNVSQSKGRG